MEKLTFKRQLWLSVIIILFACVLGSVFKRGIFSNIGFVLDGLLYIVHPVFPEKWKGTGDYYEKGKKYIRIAGCILVLIGLITRFGV